MTAAAEDLTRLMTQAPVAKTPVAKPLATKIPKETTRRVKTQTEETLAVALVAETPEAATSRPTVTQATAPAHLGTEVTLQPLDEPAPRRGMTGSS